MACSHHYQSDAPESSRFPCILATEPQTRELILWHTSIPKMRTLQRTETHVGLTVNLMLTFFAHKWKMKELGNV